MRKGAYCRASYISSPCLKLWRHNPFQTKQSNLATWQQTTFSSNATSFWEENLRSRFILVVFRIFRVLVMMQCAYAPQKLGWRRAPGPGSWMWGRGRHTLTPRDVSKQQIVGCCWLGVAGGLSAFGSARQNDARPRQGCILGLVAPHLKTVGQASSAMRCPSLVTNIHDAFDRSSLPSPCLLIFKLFVPRVKPPPMMRVTCTLGWKRFSAR